MQLHEFLTPKLRHSPSTPDMVAAVLREAILAGALEPRQPVRQDDVAEQLEVSKIPVREALRRLEAEGLVTFQPNRGVAVTALSVRESQEIMEMRLSLETLALRHAFAAMSARDLRRAQAVLEELELEEDSAQRSALNWEFHACLYTPAERPLLLATIHNLHLRVERYMRLILSTLQHHGTSQQEHRILLAACTARDVDAATRILAQHIETAGTLLRDYLTALSRRDAPATDGASPPSTKTTTPRRSR